MVMSALVEVGYVSRISNSLWLAERTPAFGNQTKHCASLPEGVNFLKDACSQDVSVERTTEVQVEQYVVSYLSNYHPL